MIGGTTSAIGSDRCVRRRWSARPTRSQAQAAAIVQEEDFDLDCYPNSGAVLVALARAAGFEVA
jgi:hypothetical protein